MFTFGCLGNPNLLAVRYGGYFSRQPDGIVLVDDHAFSLHVDRRFGLVRILTVAEASFGCVLRVSAEGTRLVKKIVYP